MGTEKSVLARNVLPDRFYDAFFINEYGMIEALRASRYNTCYSVVLMDIEGPGADAVSEVVKKAYGPVLESVRNCDVCGLDGEGRVAVILPETDYFGSLMTIRKLTRATARVAEQADGITFRFSHATFPRDGNAHGELVNRAEKRLAERKGSLWERLDLQKKLFWEAVAALLGTGYKELENSSFDAGKGYELPEAYIDQLNALITKEISDTPHRKGIFYLSARTPKVEADSLRVLREAGKCSTKVFVVSGEGTEPARTVETPGVTSVFVDDPRLKEVFFAFYLNEETGYALIGRENWGATYSCFHSSDAYLVEGLISKFQKEYSLQEQLG